MPAVKLIVLGLLTSITVRVYSQDSLGTNVPISDAYLRQITAKAKSINRQVSQSADRYLTSFRDAEILVKRKMRALDSGKAEQLFGNVEARYADMVQEASSSGEHPYLSYLDTLITSLKFATLNPVAGVSQTAQSAATEALEELRKSLGKANGIGQYLDFRKKELVESLNGFDLRDELSHLTKQAHYFSEKIVECKSLLADKKSAERKAIALLRNSGHFKRFMAKHSELSQLFPAPAGPENAQVNLVGLQTQASVLAALRKQFGGEPNAMPTGTVAALQDARGKLDDLKTQQIRLGDNFLKIDSTKYVRVNSQKAKRFKDRLEFNVNVQSQRANRIFPMTTDLGFTAGYKLNDRSLLLVGGSYKIGLGENFRHIRLSHQGVGLRTNIDWRLKGELFLTGGYELNYRTEIRSWSELQSISAWQPSGLLGISRTLPFGGKFIKKTKAQLLFDFLAGSRTPQGSALLFRMGYTF